MALNNILLAINVRWWNAEAAYALNVARGLIKLGLSVWVIVNRDSPAHQKAVESDVPVLTDIALDAISPFRQWLNYKKLINFIDQNNINVINSFKSNGSFLFNLIRLRRQNITYIKTRGEARPPKYHFLNNYFYGTKSCDGIITVGDQVKQWINRLQIKNQRVHTIYYGDSPLESKTDVDAETVRKRLRIRADIPLFALLGRTQKVKGHMILLKAMLKLSARDFHALLLVKDLDEFPEEIRSINAFISNHKLVQKVTILGFQQNLPEVLSCVDCGVIPSISSEVNCRVAVEFFSMGTPVIAFPTGSLPEIVQHKKNGHLCSEKSENALAEGIQWVMDNQILWPEIRKQAYKTYQENYSLEQLARKTLEFYQYCTKK